MTVHKGDVTHVIVSEVMGTDLGAYVHLRAPDGHPLVEGLECRHYSGRVFLGVPHSRSVLQIKLLDGMRKRSESLERL